MSLFVQRQSAGIAGILLLVTTLALLSQSITTTREIPLADAELTAVDDRSEGGHSKATLAQKNDGLHLSCLIQKSTVAWPYCSASFNFFDGKEGIDLSRYSNFKLWIRYAKRRPQGIRFQARNFNPAYSNINDDMSLKYNTVEFYAGHAPYPMEIPLQSFQVPSWWLVLRKLSHKYGAPEFSDVHSIDVVTGYIMPEGEYDIIIDKIALQGKWISNDQLYLGLLIIWAFVGFLYWLSNWSWVNRFKPDQQNPSRNHQERALFTLIAAKNRELQQSLELDSATAGIATRDINQYLFNKAEQNRKLSILLIEPDCRSGEKDNMLHQISVISKILTQSIRQTDTLARWGKWAFILLCPNTELAYASQLAEKLRVKVENECNNNEGLSISLGIAQLREDSPELLLKDAEKALAVAKTHGNCLIAATPSTAVLGTI